LYQEVADYTIFTLGFGLILSASPAMASDHTFYVYVSIISMVAAWVLRRSSLSTFMSMVIMLSPSNLEIISPLPYRKGPIQLMSNWLIQTSRLWAWVQPRSLLV